MTTPAHVQDNAKTVTASSVVVPFTSPLTAGNTVFMVAALGPGVDTTSVTDNLGNPWIQAATSYQGFGGTELWYSRGVQAGAASVTIITTASVAVTANVSEFSGLYYVDPLDQWAQGFQQSTSGSVTSPVVTPRQTNDLFLFAINSSASISSTPSSYLMLANGGDTTFSPVYYLNASSVAQQVTWGNLIGASVTTIGACFRAGASGVNPRLRFPETLVQISTTNQYLNPINGVGTWTNISSYVQRMNIGPYGRQHELDRVQATSAQIDVNARDGSFNSWNKNGFLYNGGNGLSPMNPIMVTAAWNGITYPKFFGYLRNVALNIVDAVNQTATIAAVDIFQLLALKYLSNNNYAQQVASDGGANLAAYYRCGDQIGTYTILDYSGNNNTGSLVSGPGGVPLYGLNGPILYDANTALDLTNGTNIANGSFCTIDYTTEPPTVHNPLTPPSGASVTNYSSSGAYVKGGIQGPDGNMWFCYNSGTGQYGVIKMIPTTGTFTFYSCSGAANMVSITTDGTNLWAVDSGYGKLYKVTTAGVATGYTVVSGSGILSNIAYGPDGNFWIADTLGAVWKVTPTGTVTKYVPTGATACYGICKGPDNNLWITGSSATGNALWKVTTAGASTLYNPGQTGGGFGNNGNTICSGPDGNLWIITLATSGSYIVKIATTGSVLASYPLPATTLGGICSGSDGNLWCSDWDYYSTYGSTILKVSTSGSYQRYLLSSNPNVFAGPICMGPSNTVWTSDILGGYGVFKMPLSGFGSWTFECWFKWTSNNAPTGTTVPNGILLHSSSSSLGVPVDIQLGQVAFSQALTSGTIQNYTNAIFVGSNYNQSLIAVPTINMFDGRWHHLVVNSGITSPMNAYLDGTLVRELTTTITTVGGLTGVSIGGTPQSVNGVNPLGSTGAGGTVAGANFPGTITEVALYNGINLSPAQVANHYQVGTWFQQVELGAVVGDVTASRLSKVVTVLGLNPSTVLSIPYPFVTSLYAETNALTTTSGLNYIQTMTETEPGVIFQNPSGTISAYNAQYQYLNPLSNTSQAVFGDSLGAPYHYEGTSLKIATDDLDTWNDIQTQSGRSGSQLQEWGPNQSSAASVSLNAYGPRTLQGLTSLQQEGDVDALSLAQNYANWYNEPIVRIVNISVNSQSNGGNNIPQQLGRGLMDQVTVSYAGQAGGTALTQNSLIEQITDVVDIQNPTWQTTWALSPYEILMTPTVLGSFKFGATAGQTGYGQLTL